MGKLIKDGIIYIVGGALTKATPLILLPILMSFLSPAELGDVSIYVALVGFFLIFNSFSSESVVSVDFFKMGRDKVNQSINDVFSSLGLITILLLAASEIFKEFGAEHLSLKWPYFQLAIFVGAAQIISFIHLSIWQAEKASVRYGAYAVAQSAFDILLSLFLVVVLLLAAEGRIWGYSAASLLFAAYSILWLIKNKYLNFKLDLASWRETMRYGIHLLPHAIAAWVVVNINRFLISEYIDSERVGIYFVSTQIGMVITFLAVSAQRALIPYMFELLADKENPQTSQYKIVQLASYYFLAVIVISFLCFLVFRLVLENYAGGAYQASADILPWIMLGVCFHAMGMVATNIILFSKRTFFLSISTISAAVIHVPIAIWFIKNYSIEGAAISFFITSFLSFIMSASSSIYVMPLPWLKRKSRQN